jgi:GDP-4-dehydro-6-deoxy-D-mannose reductase
LGLPSRVLIVGSADEYGLVDPTDLPVDEDTPLRPLNPYAVSKVAQDFLGYQYYLGRGLDVVRVRPFNHIGARQNAGFVVADFCQQIARIEANLQPPVMRVGNLAAQRDFTDVRDTVRAYHLALTRGESGQVYNIGSSRACSIQEILDRLLALSPACVRVEPDRDRMRPSDVPAMVCDSTRIRERTGWRPEISLDESLRAALDDWRERVH